MERWSAPSDVPAGLRALVSAHMPSTLDEVEVALAAARLGPHPSLGEYDLQELEMAIALLGPPEPFREPVPRTGPTEARLQALES